MQKARPPPTKGNINRDRLGDKLGQGSGRQEETRSRKGGRTSQHRHNITCGAKGGKNERQGRARPREPDNPFNKRKKEGTRREDPEEGGRTIHIKEYKRTRPWRRRTHHPSPSICRGTRGYKTLEKADTPSI